MRLKFTSALLGFAVLFAVQLNASAATRAQILADELARYSSCARRSYDPGSPIKPPQKVVICHKGHTINAAPSAVPGHLAHGDYLGPCIGGVARAR